jgi:outer membrane protein
MFIRLLLLTVLFITQCNSAAAANLMDVYQQALSSDPVYQQAIAQRMATSENIPINMSALLPQAGVAGGPLLSKTHITGVPDSSALTTSSRGYSFTLSLSQTVFNYAQFRALTGAQASGKQADAALNAATQDLMLRVATAYFAVLKDEDNLRYNLANKKSFNKQLDQIHQQYKVGLKTNTDVDTSQSSYDTAVAGYIAAETTLANDQENLRAITGTLYPSLARLSENFPLITPKPADMNAWVETAERQNWAIKSAQYANRAAMENIKQQNAGHYPTVSLQGSYNVSYSNTIGNGSTTNPEVNPSTTENNINGTLLPGNAHSNDAAVNLNFGIPLFQGGLVVAQTKQAKYNYQITTQQLEQSVRATINNTRQSYLGIILGIQQIQADKQAIKSTKSSYLGLHEGWRVGTQTLVSVLNQQQKVFMAQTQYATDRYAYVYNLLKLKQAAGTLSADDLQAINAWLISADNLEDAEEGEGEGEGEKTHRYSTHRHKTKSIQQADNSIPTLPEHPISLAKADVVNANLGKPDFTLSP